MKLAVIVLVVLTVVSAQQTSQVSIHYNIASVSASGASTQIQTITTEFQQLRTAIVSQQSIQVTEFVQKIRVNLKSLQVKVPAKNRKIILKIIKEITKITAKETSGKNKKALKHMKKSDKLWKQFQSGKSKESSEESGSDESDESGESSRPRIQI